MEDSNFYKPECEGCKAKTDWKDCRYLIGHGYLQFHEIKKCPCIDCIIKMMCVEPCDKYNEVVELGESRRDREISQQRIFDLL